MKPTLLRRALHLSTASLMAVSGCATAAELAGRAVLPVATFAPGPTSGQYLGAGPVNGIQVPFLNQQPVQGFSAVADNGDGTFLVMSDNGFGNIQTSADYNLRVYTIRPNFETASGGAGTIEVLGNFELRDPDRRIPFTIVNHFSAERVLTGADFDIESMQVLPDGTLWFGDEFGPFMIHTDATGRVLERPVEMPDMDNPGQFVRAPQNPNHEEIAGLRIMNAARAHARANGGTLTPVFSAFHVEFSFPAENGFPASDPNAHYVRGSNTPPDLANATSSIHNITLLRAAGFPVVPYTVNDIPRMLELMRRSVDGLITDRPDLLLEAITQFDANNDGTPGDYLGPDGLPDGTRFDFQGHRGARNLRPENTIPAFEAALDNFVTTLETDSGTTLDGQPFIQHDPYLEPGKCRRADGTPYTLDNQVLIRNLTAAQLQAQFICDRVFRGPSQSNDLALSPVSVALAGRLGLPHPYAPPTVRQLYRFVSLYQQYYASGLGRLHPQAALRATTAARVRFNIETKINPRIDSDSVGNVYRDRTTGPVQMARRLAIEVVRAGMQARTDIQSFDFRTLLWVQANHPDIRTVYLFGDFPIYDGVDTDDGTNMQPGPGSTNTPWMAGMRWPYRVTATANPFRVPASGGFEGMARSVDGTRLYPLLERPLAGADPTRLQITEFLPAVSRYSRSRWFYPLDARGSNIGDFVLFNNAREGLVIERDNSQGNTTGYKAINRIQLRAPFTDVTKSELVNLQAIADPAGISLPAGPGDVGLGNPFSFPFVTIENVVVLGPNRIGVINDNNFPFSIGRHVGSGAPDDNEFILIDLDQTLRLP